MSNADDARRAARTRTQTGSGRAVPDRDDRSARSPRASRQGAPSGSRARQQQSPSREGSRAARSQSGQNGAVARSRRPADTAQTRQSSPSRSRSQSQSRSQRQRGAQQPASPLQNLLSGDIVGIGVVAFVIIIVLVLVFTVMVPSCSGAGSGNRQDADGPAQTGPGLVQTVALAKVAAQYAVESASQVDSLETSDAKIEALVALLGEEEAAKLVAQAKADPDALWIAAHADQYAFEGIETQYRLLKLAADEPAAVPFVRDFPAKYPMADASTDYRLAMKVASPSGSVPTTPVPHLYQWDRRWAYTIYSSDAFGLSGSGPTAMAMVYQALNKVADRTPHDMALLAEERGYMTEYGGTSSSFFIELAPELGFSCQSEYPDSGSIASALREGKLVIAHLGAGSFSSTGLYLVLAGLADDGAVIINDPYSPARSAQTWDADYIASESWEILICSK